MRIAMASRSCISCAGGSDGAHIRRCVCCSGPRTRRGCARSVRTRTVSSSLRSTWSSAAKVSSSAPASTGWRSSASPSCHATPSCSSAPAFKRCGSTTRTPSWDCPSTLCSRMRWCAPTAKRRGPRSGREESSLHQPLAPGVRVIAGEFRGRTLVAPRGRGVRPTSDRVREALFSILGPVDGLRVLDLFAGSGALAIEALSRGAARATLVDSAAGSVAAIRRNLEALECDAEVRRQRAGGFLEQASAAGRQYDLVFVDPPYRHANAFGRELGQSLLPVLAPGARVVSESDRGAPLQLETLPLLV